MGTSLWVVRVRLRSSSTGVSASTSGRFGVFGVGVVQCIPVDPPKSWFWSTKIIYFDGEKFGKLPLTVGQTQPVPKRKKGGVHTLRRRFEIRCEPCITLLWDGLLYHVLSMILSVILSALTKLARGEWTLQLVASPMLHPRWDGGMNTQRKPTQLLVCTGWQGETCRPMSIHVHKYLEINRWIHSDTKRWLWRQRPTPCCAMRRS